MTVTAEKNKVNQLTAWLTFCMVTFPGAAAPLRLVKNNEDLTWDGETWQAHPIDVSEITENYLGELTGGDISIGNVSRLIDAYLEDYVVYTKANGYYPIAVNIYTINSDYLAGSATKEYEFVVTKYITNAYWAVFTLGISNPFNARSPEARLLKNQCQVKNFKDVTCGYAGAETLCDRTLTRCRELGNSGRYGGFPGVGDASKRWQI